jgi:hypothetical protein
MTLIPDRDDENLLSALLANDHLAIGGLLVELAREPATPGVQGELAATLDHQARVHMAAVERVLVPALAHADQVDVVEEVTTNHEQVRRHLTELADRHAPHGVAVRRLEEDLAEQFAFEEGVLAPALVERLDGRSLEGLGFAFSEAADTGVVAEEGTSEPGDDPGP